MCRETNPSVQWVHPHASGDSFLPLIPHGPSAIRFTPTRVGTAQSDSAATGDLQTYGSPPREWGQLNGLHQPTRIGIQPGSPPREWGQPRCGLMHRRVSLDRVHPHASGDSDRNPSQSSRHIVRFTPTRVGTASSSPIIGTARTWVLLAPTDTMGSPPREWGQPPGPLLHTPGVHPHASGDSG